MRLQRAVFHQIAQHTQVIDTEEQLLATISLTLQTQDGETGEVTNEPVSVTVKLVMGAKYESGDSPLEVYPPKHPDGNEFNGHVSWLPLRAYVAAYYRSQIGSRINFGPDSAGITMSDNTFVAERATPAWELAEQGGGGW